MSWKENTQHTLEFLLDGFTLDFAHQANFSSLIELRAWLQFAQRHGKFNCSVIPETRAKVSKWDLIKLTEKAMAPHSSTLAWKIPWVEEPGRLQSMESLRVGLDWVTSLSLFIFLHWRRKWQPTPVFFPGESQGRRSLGGLPSMGSHRVGHDWSDLA